jgi:hypothetical protein
LYDIERRVGIIKIPSLAQSKGGILGIY